MKPMVLLGGVVGTVTAVWLYYNFVGFLNLLSGMIPPVGAVIILHYFTHKSEYGNKNYKYKDFNFAGIFAVIVGALIGIFIPWGIKPLNSLVSAGIVFIILDNMLNKKNSQEVINAY